jgi:hypothetical protein
LSNSPALHPAIQVAISLRVKTMVPASGWLLLRTSLEGVFWCLSAVAVPLLRVAVALPQKRFLVAPECLEL